MSEEEINIIKNMQDEKRTELSHEQICAIDNMIKGYKELQEKSVKDEKKIKEQYKLIERLADSYCDMNEHIADETGDWWNEDIHTINECIDWYKMYI